MSSKYLFTSERLGFRPWKDQDLSFLADMNSNEQVMEFFPTLQTPEESKAMLKRMQDHYTKHGHTYFVVELIETGEVIGFIGLAYQDYESVCTPAVDIGWRLTPSFWGKGLATEGAKRCLEFAFNELKLDKVVATCVEGNINSEKVMKKIGMTKMGFFMHPKLEEYPSYHKCIWYQIINN